MELPVRLLFSLAVLMTLTACEGMPLMEMAVVGGGVVAYNEMQPGPNGEKPELETVPPQAKSTAGRVANQFRDNVKATMRHAKDWWNYDPKPGHPKSVPDSYCYRAQGDVLCYRAPMPGWEHRLVGYQGTFAKAPPPVMMEPLPGQSVDAAMLPSNRVANAKPVFNELPPEIKEEPKNPTELLEADPQNVHETIADPTLSPQL